MTARILVVEDDEAIRRTIERGLRVAGHEPSVALGVGDGRTMWSGAAWDLVLLDVMLPDGNGLDLLAERRAAGDVTPVVLLSAREEADLPQRAAAAGASGYLRKPFAYADLLAHIDRFAARGR